MGIKKKTVLLIDDDSDFCNLITAILEAKGMVVIVAHTIKMAHAYIEKSIPNIIILDMELEKESGIDFLKDRSESMVLSKIPVIVCSMQNIASIVKAAIRFGADDYLLKPIRQAWLIQRIRKNLIKEGSATYFFKNDESIQVIVEGTAVSVSSENLLIRSSMGFDKGSAVGVSISQGMGAKPVEEQFRSDVNSQFNTAGPFDTFISLASQDEEEKKKYDYLKIFGNRND